MAFRLVQFRDSTGGRGVAAFLEDATAVRLSGVTTTYELALAAIRDGVSLLDAARARAGEAVDLITAEAEGRLLGPIAH